MSGCQVDKGWIVTSNHGMQTEWVKKYLEGWWSKILRVSADDCHIDQQTEGKNHPGYLWHQPTGLKKKKGRRNCPHFERALLLPSPLNTDLQFLQSFSTDWTYNSSDHRSTTFDWCCILMSLFCGFHLLAQST